jgi:hypothetical protein
MKIFKTLKKDEEYSKINHPLDGLRLEPKPVALKKSDVTTSPLDRVTVILVQWQIF